MKLGNIAKAGTFALLLGGCAGEIIQEKMSTMIGRPASHVFAKLGLPDAEGKVAGRKFYVWGTQASGSYTLPQYNTGTIYNPYGGTSTYSYTAYQQHSYNYFCKIRIFVDSKDRITTYDFEGNEGGCRRFSSQLDR